MNKVNPLGFPEAVTTKRVVSFQGSQSDPRVREQVNVALPGIGWAFHEATNRDAPTFETYLSVVKAGSIFFTGDKAKISVPLSSHFSFLVGLIITKSQYHINMMCPHD